MRPVIFLLLSSLLILTGCKKEAKRDPNEYTIEYRVTGASNKISQAYIFDKNMNNVEAYLSNQGGPSWSQTVRTTKKPFTANMMVVVSNPLEFEYMFTLEVLVEGQVKKSVSTAAPKDVSTLARIEYLVE